MLPYLLALSVPHARAPGVLNRVFSPAEDFPEAPPWMGPVLGFSAGEPYYAPCTLVNDRLAVYGSAGTMVREAFYLDFRVRVVAVHIWSLCARAMGEKSGAYWTITRTVGEFCLHSPGGSRAFNWMANGFPYDTKKVLSAARLPTDSIEVFSIALFLELAPKIAALPLFGVEK